MGTSDHHLPPPHSQLFQGASFVSGHRTASALLGFESGRGPGSGLVANYRRSTSVQFASIGALETCSTTTHMVNIPRK